ncbi:Unknown protein sequence [Pseudomonas coronafaciens pv. oryzae]|nr:Unknown protein sequence [Pseudomonas coronafaciens pv. oryzae]
MRFIRYWMLRDSSTAIRRAKSDLKKNGAQGGCAPFASIVASQL